MSLVRAALDGLVPYEPGKPEDEVQRELGLERVVKLASNEGPWGPFPAALEALARTAPTLNRYPDGGAFHLRNALAERHGIAAPMNRAVLERIRAAEQAKAGSPRLVPDDVRAAATA